MIFYNLYGRSVGAGSARGARGASGASGFLDVLKFFMIFYNLNNLWKDLDIFFFHKLHF